MLSRFTSFHHKNIIVTKRNIGNKTIRNDILRLNHKTELANKENNTKEIRKGQKEV
jgi:hypothetical protein